MNRQNLQAEFRKRGRWVTKFVVEGKAYGGKYDVTQDHRPAQFFRCFPQARNVLELGSLEGGHTFVLAQHPGVTRVLGIEGRPANLEKAGFVQSLLGMRNVEFVLANLETADLARFGKFDAVFCVGLLYHLPRPWELIAQAARVSPGLFIWTHYAPEKRANTTVNGYKGMMYRESGWRDPLSGLSPKSFWPTLDGLLTMLRDNGYPNIRPVEQAPAHAQGPAVTLAASAD